MQKMLELLEYNFWANDQFIMRLVEVNEVENEIVKQFSHLLAAHRVWLDRMANRGTLPSVWDNDFKPTDWEGINVELYNETSDLVKSDALDNIVSYKNSKGHLYKNTVEEIIRHILNHSTHHRAQIALLMRQNHRLPPASDLIFYYRR